ncbi:MAG: hypothetical protein F4099_07025 [Synechococcus sp. SB0673_bin_10]|nr:hypothetical protein [Synechococcus sp. SB0667_bin_8]MYG64099.1 hypothetical protein [Synechococcus sp. SB0675_bin_7]MYI72245.1 hypothetical protein [Synechococcus sp. SB0673_bin_10]MYK86036.1 hypothetical protein [Synechococcus sp. SB0669_bin_7]
MRHVRERIPLPELLTCWANWVRIVLMLPVRSSIPGGVGVVGDATPPPRLLAPRTQPKACRVGGPVNGPAGAAGGDSDAAGRGG